MPSSEAVVVEQVAKPDQVIEWLDEVAGFIHTEAYSS
jgi:hypothetical protein